MAAKKAAKKTAKKVAKKATKKKAAEKAKRKVLVIMSNRFQRSQKPRFVELDCKSDGSILSETLLKREPKQPVYDEVWENDEGKTSLDSCTRIKRKYRHRLEKPQK